MSYDPPQELSIGAFGELITAPKTPIAQITAEYGIIESTTLRTELSGATATTVNSNFVLDCGTNPAGLSAIQSQRPVRYRPGQGITCEFSAFFSVGGTGNQQVAGFITSENSLVFTMLQGVFGISLATGGIPEYQELTLTTPAAGAEVATVTINGTAYPVNLTAGTVQHNAYEIATQLDGVVPAYTITSNNDQVLAQAFNQGSAGAFAFTSATAVGAWAQITVGQPVTNTFIAQADWNRDTVSWLDPTKGNVYKIQYQFLGYGAISFQIEEPETGRFLEVHKVEYANKNTIPSTSSPTFRIGWANYNFGGTTSYVMGGASAGGFIEGNINRGGPIGGSSGTNAAVGTTATNIVTLRNRTHFGNKFNRAELYPTFLTLSTFGTKGAIYEIYVNATFGGDLIFQYEDKDDSIVETAKDAVTITGGQLLASIIVAQNESQIIRFNDLPNQDTVVQAGDVFTIAARVPSGAAAEMIASVGYQSDY